MSPTELTDALNDVFDPDGVETIGPFPLERERRRYALLQAAAVIYVSLDKEELPYHILANAAATAAESILEHLECIEEGEGK
jgi:hypothetical protein